jgi:hypothetical protein
MLHVLHFLPFLLFPAFGVALALLLGLVVFGSDVVPEPSDGQPAEVGHDHPVEVPDSIEDYQTECVKGSTNSTMELSASRS